MLKSITHVLNLSSANINIGNGLIGIKVIAQHKDANETQQQIKGMSSIQIGRKENIATIEVV